MNPALLAYVKQLSLKDKKDLLSKTLKTVEEVGDIAKVMLSYSNAYATTHRFITREQILEESADALLCILSVLYDAGFSDDELDAMMAIKAQKWAMLQAKEDEVTYPIPYEVHVSVRTNKPSETEGLSVFCQTKGVKLIALELGSVTSDIKTIDVMTSSVVYGDNKTAYLYACNLADELKENGYDVVRVKIETVPWHPAAPIDNQPMPPNTYFEAHLPVILRDGCLADSLRADIAELQDKRLHVSRNFLRADSTTGVTKIMVTYRHDNIGRKQFEQRIAEIHAAIESKGWTLGKYHTEFALYDTNQSHDASWIANSYASASPANV